jgi:hypothetical protein
MMTPNSWTTIADDDTHESAGDDQRVTENVPDNVTYESLVAESESLNTDVDSSFVRQFVGQNDSGCVRE